ncbi:hypothetical protein K458DRAFT_418260 [Lentithecium fluviatile CBS 122367]|uniref:F-box domain-containing protein n=1 Tax=Lentithecium fluviatile CBS 122367 TaxID=1168545 RepID=A0A6G1J0C5_9PLEO|nr:hypothetical protein K458DRAFT_418260 [Lentithecium fluviatile CBS 122367]
MGWPDQILDRIIPHQWRISRPVFQFPSSHGPATLPGLPTEIMLEIASHLPVSSVAILTLVSKHFQCVLGTKSRGQLGDETNERRVFSHLLARNLSDYVADSGLIRKLPSSRPSSYKKGSRRHYSEKNGFLVPYTRFGYAVTWPHVLLALKRDAYSAPHRISLSAFDHASKSGSRKETVHFNALARIVSGHLLLRCTYKTPAVSRKQAGIEYQGLAALELDICRHSSTKRRGFAWFDNHLANALLGGGGRKFTIHEMISRGGDETRNYGWDDSLDADNLNDLLVPTNNASADISGQCTFCFTEYTVSKSGTKRGEIDIKVWQDLGTGSFLSDELAESFDTQWKALVSSTALIRQFPFGSVRAAFEEGDGSRLVAGPVEVG